MAAKKLNEKQRLSIVAEYLAGESAKTLSKKYNITPDNIRLVLKKKKIKLIKRRNQTKYTLNENYFDKIDTEDKAYFLGLMYADGYNYEKQGYISISLQERDRDILDKFSKYINSNKPLYFYNRSKEGANIQNQYRIMLHSKHLSQQLSKLGCHQNKSLDVKIPCKNPIPKSLFRHFLRGLWDGDGNYCLFKQFDKSGGYHYCFTTTLVVSCDLNLQIKNFIENKFGFNCRFKKVGKVSTLIISSRISTYKFIQYIYKNAKVYLNRKHQQCLGYTNAILQRYRYRCYLTRKAKRGIKHN